jgi:hypothetical protein
LPVAHRHGGHYLYLDMASIDATMNAGWLTDQGGFKEFFQEPSGQARALAAD